MSAAWTCPFCPLACDHLDVRAEGAALALAGGECVRAARSLGRFAPKAAAVPPLLDGQPCALDRAVAAAARLLAASRQPLFAGLGCDVAGARALYALACATGAVCDAAGSEALMQGLRALQDRGQFSTTLAEVRQRADLIVFVGGVPVDIAPLIGPRCGIGEAAGPRRHVVVLGAGPGDAALLAGWAALPATTVESVPLMQGLFETLALLNAGLAGRRPVPALQPLLQRLQGARYAVLVGAPARWPAPASLLVEALQRLVMELNRRSRAAALWIGGGDGAATANQTFAWLSGLPLRSRAGPRGLEHDPVRFDAARLLAAGAVDALLWVSCFDAEAAPPPAGNAPLIVLAPPGSAAAARAAVFMPVATPGIGCDGHVFRTDGTVLMPLRAVRPDGLPTVAQVATQILRVLQAGASAGPAASLRPEPERAP